MKFRSHDQLARAIYPPPEAAAPASIPKSADQQMGERIYGDHADPLKAAELNIAPALVSYFEGKRSQYAFRGNRDAITQLEKLRPEVEAFARKVGMSGEALQTILSEMQWFEGRGLDQGTMRANLDRSRERGAGDVGGDATFRQKELRALDCMNRMKESAPLFYDALANSGAQTALPVIDALAHYGSNT